MGYISVDSVSGVMQVSVSKNMWFYFIITAPLMFLTFLAWWLWEVKVRRKARRKASHIEDNEKLKDV